MVNKLMLQTGADIPFLSGGVTIHQPQLIEIAMIGEEDFFAGNQSLLFSKDFLPILDNVNLDNFSNFEILMSIINDKNPVAKIQKNKMLMTLSLLFPCYKVVITSDKIRIIDEEREIEGFIGSSNFEEFKSIIKEIFCLGKSVEEEYSPQGEYAKRIAKKFEERRRRLAEQKKDVDDGKSIFDRYMSILSVGLAQDMNEIAHYTVYQLLDAFQRYQLKVNFDWHVKAKMAGAKDLKDVDDWMKDIHSGL